MYVNYKYSILRLLTIWTLLEVEAGPNKVVKWEDFAQDWDAVLEYFVQHFEHYEPHKPKAHVQYSKAQEFINRFRVKESANKPQPHHINHLKNVITSPKHLHFLEAGNKAQEVKDNHSIRSKSYEKTPITSSKAKTSKPSSYHTTSP